MFRLFIVVVASVLVPVTTNRFVVVAFVMVAFVTNRLVNIAVIAERIFVIERFDQIVLVPVVLEFPDTKLPLSFTLKVEEPTEFLVWSTVDVDDVPTPVREYLLDVVVARSTEK